MNSGGEVTKGKGLEACYSLPGFDAGTIATDFTTSDVNGDGKIGTGEVWYKGEATNQAHQCYAQLAKVVDGYANVFAQGTRVKVYGMDGKEQKIEGSTLARITDSPYVNSTFKDVRIDIASYRGTYSIDVTAYKRGGDGKACECHIEGRTLDDTVAILVQKLEDDACKVREKVLW